MTITVAHIFDTIDANIAKNPAKATSINAVFLYEITGDGGGTWSVDLREETTSDFVKASATENPNVTITMAAETWIGIIIGAVKPMQALMMGKIKIKGDMGLAMKLERLLSLARKE